MFKPVERGLIRSEDPSEAFIQPDKTMMKLLLSVSSFSTESCGSATDVAAVSSMSGNEFTCQRNFIDGIRN